MGDHRASIKIEMEFHGVKDKTDMWVNYQPDSSEHPGVDSRVIEFIQSVYERGMAAWDLHMTQLNKVQRERDNEVNERAELARLQQKYRR